MIVPCDSSRALQLWKTLNPPRKGQRPSSSPLTPAPPYPSREDAHAQTAQSPAPGIPSFDTESADDPHEDSLGVDAEYAAAAHTTREVLFVQNMLSDLKVNINKPTVIFIDNQAAIKIAENLGVTARNKHFEDSIHFFRHQVDHRRVIPVHISTKLQKADGFTKLLDNSAFKLWKTNVVQFDAR
ncbi:hypothetical protein AB1Y20_018871 [Prymnesium parvum]|uniref:Copia protein n=1 Tax=Prymnesium parvum TaxID=97485 RepID=A0AB34JQZ0_PRYPA